MRPSLARSALPVRGPLPELPLWVGGGLLLALSCGVALAGEPRWFEAWVLLTLAPLLEEAVARVGIQDRLARASGRPFLANLTVAALFALAHVAVRGDAAAALVFVPALAIGVVYARTGKLRHCVLLHSAMNASWLAATSWP